MTKGLQWVPKNPPALKDTEELIVKGICRIRNNFFHGEKFVGEPNGAGWNRDEDLVTEALAVLKMASEKLNLNA